MIDVVAEWPELFEGLDERDTEGIRAACASGVAVLGAVGGGVSPKGLFLAGARARAEARVGRAV